MSGAAVACRPPPLAARAAQCSKRRSAASSRQCSAWSPPQAARRAAGAAGRRAAWAAGRRTVGCRAAQGGPDWDDDEDEDEEDEEEEEDLDAEALEDEDEELLRQLEEASLAQLENDDPRSHEFDVLRQFNATHWEPAPREELERLQQLRQRSAAAAAARAAATAAPGEAAPLAAAEAAEAAAGAAPSYEELLASLPTLRRQMQLGAQEESGLYTPPTEEQKDHAWAGQRDRGFYMAREAAPQLAEWDLRAKMEKRRRQQLALQAWNKRRASVGLYPSVGADWRTDVRCQDTGDPTDPTYREWSHKEIWDLITLNGTNADPRDVQVWVRDPDEIADAPAQGAKYVPEPEEYFESIGRLIPEDELAGVMDSAGTDGAHSALLTSEFGDFDEELVGDFDAEYASGGGGGGTGGSAGGEEEFA